MTATVHVNSDNHSNDGNGNQVDHDFPLGIYPMNSATIRMPNLRITPISPDGRNGTVKSMGNKLTLALLVCLVTLVTLPCWAADTVTVYEAESASQTGRPITHGRVFLQGEIPSGYCPRPYVGGVALTTSNYQADVKTTYPDGSVKFAVMSYQNLAGLTSGGNVTVTFQKDNVAGCNNSGFLTASGMASFSSWNAQLITTPQAGTNSAAAVTTDFKTLLAAVDPGTTVWGDCQNDYWLKGPVVTAVMVQDCTSTWSADLGWKYDGANMVSDGVHSSYTGISQYATIHPMAILYFYPATNTVQVEVIIEAPEPSTKVQNQNIASFVIKTGSSPTTVYDSSTDANVTSPVLMAVGQRFRKVVWSGTAPGGILIDHNFPYLISTKAIPYYDQSVTADPTKDNGGEQCSYATFAAGDKGDINGQACLTKDLGSNDEGAILQRDTLLYLYNMGVDCGTANGKCAKAWYMQTAQRGARDSGLAASVTGGAGFWNNMGNLPYFIRDNRSAASGQQSGTYRLYCSGFDNKDSAVNTTSCTGASDGLIPAPTGPNTALGHMISKDAHSDDLYGGVGSSTFFTSPTGAAAATYNGWSIGGMDHWQSRNYAAYLLTGSPYFLENMFAEASMALANSDPSYLQSSSAGATAFINPGSAILREHAWGLQSVGRAGMFAVDGSAEQSYYKAKVNANNEIWYGWYGITNDGLGLNTLVPSDVSCRDTAHCSAGYVASTANRFNFGAATFRSACTSGPCTINPIKLHSPATGNCLTFSNTASYMSAIAVTNDSDANPGNAVAWLGFSTPPYVNATVSGGAITALTIVDQGSGFTPDSPPAITLYARAASGSGFAATGTITGGKLVSINKTNNGSGYPANAGTSATAWWQVGFIGQAYGHLRELGFPGAAAVHDELGKAMVNAFEQLALTHQIYLLGAYQSPVQQNNGSPTNCVGSGGTLHQVDPFLPDFTSFAAASHPALINGLCTFDTSQTSFLTTNVNATGCGVNTATINDASAIGFACGDHDYRVVMRAMAAFLPQFNVSSTDAGCPGGTCTAADTWAIAQAEVPYFGNALHHRTWGGSSWSNGAAWSSTCVVASGDANFDNQIKFAIDARPGGVTITACNSLSPSSATINTSATQNFTASCTYSDSSTGDCTSSLVLTSGSPSVATVSGQTATGVSAGSSTISGTANSFACGNTSALTVQNPATKRSSLGGQLKIGGQVRQ